MRSSALFAILFLALVLALASWRFVELDRDPPLISGSAAEWTDPGAYLANARTMVHSGEWGEHLQTHALFVAPGFAFLATLWGFVFGAHYVSFAALSVVSGFAAIAATAYVASHCTVQPGTRWPIVSVCSFILLSSYTFFCFQRVPKGDMETLAFSAVTAAVFIALGARAGGNVSRLDIGLAILAGAGMVVTPFVKFYGVLFSAACAGAWILSPFCLDAKWRPRWRTLSPWIVAGCVAGALVWASWLVWLQSLGILAGMSSYTTSTVHSVSGSEATFSIHRFLQSNVFYRQPVETLLAALMIGRLFFVRHWTWASFFCTVWLLAGFAAIGAMPYQPTRYRLLFLPPIAVLGSLAWFEFSKPRQSRMTAASLVVRYSIAGWVLLEILTYALETHGLRGQRTLGIPARGLLFMILALGAGYIFERFPPRTLAALIAVAAVLVAAPQWWFGEKEKSFQLKAIAMDLRSHFPDSDFAGSWGAEVALWADIPSESRAKTTVLVEEVENFDGHPYARQWKEVRRETVNFMGRQLVIATRMR